MTISAASLRLYRPASARWSTTLLPSQLQQALEESEQRYAALFDQAFDAIILEDERARILDANPAACRMLGYSRDEYAR